MTKNRGKLVQPDIIFVPLIKYLYTEAERLPLKYNPYDMAYHLFLFADRDQCEIGSHPDT